MELFIIHQIFLRWQKKLLEKSLKEYLDTVRTNKAELVVDQNQSDVHESEQGGETAERQRQSGSSNEEE